MKLRLKTLIIVGVALLCLNLALFFTSSNWLLGDVRALERQEVQRDLQRAIDVLSDTATDLDATARDYSEWDSTYAFVNDRDPAYLRSNFVDRTFDYLRLNALLILDVQGKSIFEQGYDLLTHQRQAIPANLRPHLKADSPLLKHRSTTSAVKGILLLPEGPMLVATRPIVTSDAGGPIRGTLVLGRFLSGRELERLGRLTQLDASLQSIQSETALPEDRRAVVALKSAEARPAETRAIELETLPGNRLATYALLRDIYGHSDLLLRVTIDREIYAQGEASVRYLLAALVVVGVVFGAIALGLLERLVLSRLMHLSEQVAAVGSSGDLSRRVETLPGTDELSELANTLNATLDRLETSQAAVVAAEAQYRSIFENAIEGIFQTTPDGQFLSANPALAKIYGYESPEALMQEVSASRNLYVDPRRREEFVQVLNAQGEVSKFESQIYRQDGQVIWISEAARLVCDSSGQILCYEGTVEDITERKQSQVKLERLKDRLQAMLDAVPGIVSRVSSDLRYLEVNRHLAENFGIDCEDFVGQDIGFLGYGDEFRDFVAEFFAGSHKEDSREISRRNGRQQEDYLLVAQKYDEDRAAFIIGLDISERKAAEQALKEAESRYRSIFENAIEGIFQAAPDGQFLRVNPAMARLYGYESPEALVAAFNKAGGPPYTDPGRSQALRALLGAIGRVEEFESQAVRPDGQLIWVSENASAVRDAAGKLLYYEGTVEDVTERRRTAESLQEQSRLSIMQAEVGVALCQPGDLSDILQSCAELMGNQLNCLFVRIWTYTPDGFLTLQAQTNTLAPADLDLDTRLLRDVRRDNMAITHSSPISQIARDRHSRFERERQPKASRVAEIYFAGYPLVVEDRLVGVLALYCEQPIAKTIDDTLGWMSSAIAVGIDRTQARQELTGRREALLFQLASQIRQSLELPAVLQAAVDGIRGLLQTDRCLFAWYLDNDPPAWEAITESRAPELPSLLGRLPASPPDEGRDLERLLRADEVTRLPHPGLRQLYIDRGYSSVLAILVQTRSGAIGAIECGDCGRLRTWSDREVDLLSAVTDQLAIAIEQSELYNKAQIAAMQAQEQAKRISDAMEDLQRTQTQLIQTEKMSSLGQMVAGVAHEINNPTTFIHGNLTYARNYTTDLLELLSLYRLHYPLPAPQIADLSQSLDVDFITRDLPKTLDSMQIGADRIRQIVASLRNFSRLDQAEMKPVDIHEGLDNTLLILQHRFKANSNFPGIEVIKQYGDLPEIVCYAGQLNQVFMNIIANAIDALEECYGRNRRRARPAIVPPNPLSNSLGVEIATRPTATALLISGEDSKPAPTTPELVIRTEIITLDRVRITIVDNGTGMTPGVQSKLFDPFFTTKPVGQGTGLGLSICYQIVVEKHRGHISCNSTPGKGTEFVIEIPIEQPEWSEST